MPDDLTLTDLAAIEPYALLPAIASLARKAQGLAARNWHRSR